MSTTTQSPSASSNGPPTMAERAFLALAREWHHVATAPHKGYALPHRCDECALACLMLAAEWGESFSFAVREQIGKNSDTMKPRDVPWIDQMPWNLCVAMMDRTRDEATRALEDLTVNLDHQNSSIRIWMIKLAWHVAPFLNPLEAAHRLVKNFADTLGGVDYTIAVAARLFNTPEQFFAFLDHFKPESFEDQYQNRLKWLRENGILAAQSNLWKIESQCRKEIEKTVMALRTGAP